MATLIWTDINIYLGGYDFTGYSFEASLDLSAEMLDATAFGQTTRIHKPGLKDASLSFRGYWDQDGVNAVPDEQIFNDEIGQAASPLAIAPDGTAVGDPAYFLNMAAQSYQLGGSVGDLLPFSYSGQADTAPAMGDFVVSADAAITSSGASASQDLGADFLLATETLYVGLWVFDVDATSLDVIVQSDDNSGMTTPTTRGTFTQATGRTSEILAIPGLISERYWDVDYTLTGGATTATFAVAFGVVTE